MTITDVQTQVEEIAQALILLDAGDPETMVQIGKSLGEVASLLREVGRANEATAAEQAAGVAATCAAESSVPAAVIAAITRAVETVQESLALPAEPVARGDLDADGVPEDDATDVTGDAAEPAAEDTTDGPAADGPSDDATGANGAATPPVGLTLSPLVDEAIVAEFLSRQQDALGDVEKTVLALEAGEDADMDELKRWFHTLKGESGLLGLDAMSELCHATEDMIQAEPAQVCADRILSVLDWLGSTFAYLTDSGPAPVAIEPLVAELRANTGAEAPDAAPAPETAAVAGAAPEAVADEEPATAATTDEPQTGTPADVTPSATEAPAAPTPAPAATVSLPEVEIPDYTGKNLLELDVSLLQDFIAEANEHLDASEGHLLAIESDPHECEALNAVFRGFHTIKGLAGFAELDHIQELAHKAENLLDMGRKGEIELVGPVMDLVFESVDVMKRLVEGVVAALATTGHPAEEPLLPGLIARLIACTSGQPFGAGEARTAAPAPDVAQAGPQAQSAPEPTPEPAPEPDPAPGPPADPRDVVGKSGFVPLANMKARKKPAAAPPAAAPAPAAPEPDAAPTEPEPPTPAPASSAPAKDTPAAGAAKVGASAAVKVKEAVRVDAERLDRLIETIGEMVIAESMVSQNPEVRENISVRLAKDLDHLDKISRELQEIGMSLRMVPVRPVFQKMARLVRDLAKKTGRKVEFVMTGEDTELDKNVVDKIGDPLVHMVRNAVDHGLETSSEERTAAGKPPVGRIELRAFHKGGNICIEIEDDGRGLPRDKILAKAVERGLVREGEPLSDREIHNLIFEPGFSTAKQVTDISGRGVGMDVVRRNIEELRGTCEITSEQGKGSRFQIRLPLTLAIIEGMVISCGGEHYIVPTLSVVRLVRPTAGDISHVFDRGEMLAFEDQHLPLFRLGQLFGVPAKTDPEEAVVVVVEEEGRKIGLLADDLLGQQSIVIKSLGEAMQDTEGVAGGAIMSDGNVALILDVAGLIRVAHKSSSAVPLDEDQAEAPADPEAEPQSV
jgi:two-component system chemotaxis sensor kinase CheA